MSWPWDSSEDNSVFSIWWNWTQKHPEHLQKPLFCFHMSYFHKHGVLCVFNHPEPSAKHQNPSPSRVSYHCSHLFQVVFRKKKKKKHPFSTQKTPRFSHIFWWPLGPSPQSFRLHLGLLGLAHGLLQELRRLLGVALRHDHLRRGVQGAADAHQVLGLLEQRHAAVHLGEAAGRCQKNCWLLFGKSEKNMFLLVQKKELRSPNHKKPQMVSMLIKLDKSFFAEETSFRASLTFFPRRSAWQKLRAKAEIMLFLYAFIQANWLFFRPNHAKSQLFTLTKVRRVTPCQMESLRPDAKAFR